MVDLYALFFLVDAEQAEDVSATDDYGKLLVISVY